MERSAKRLSSLFSLGSVSSDKSTTSAPAQSDLQSRRVETSSPPPILLRSPTADVRASASTPDLHSTTRSRPSSATPVHFLSRPASAIEPQYPFSPDELKPLPYRMDERISRPSSRASSQASSRPPSPSKQFRPLTPTEEGRASTPTQEARLAKRRSWIPGRQRLDIQNDPSTPHMPGAWFVSAHEKTPYDTTPLASFYRVPELWNESGDTLIYLHSREHDRGPSFKVHSSCFAASRNLTASAYESVENGSGSHAPWSQHVQPNTFEGRMQRLSIDHGRTPSTSTADPSANDSSLFPNRTEATMDPDRAELQLCLPQALRADLTAVHARLSVDDTHTLVTVRNLFAFLTGQPLVATSHHSSLFAILLGIADLLHRFHFTNLDGSTLGEDVTINFAKIVEDHRLSDVRASREKTVEAIVLGERMRYMPLYNEGFVHGVGKWEDLVQLNSSKLLLISSTTRKRMERSTIDLGHRLGTTRKRLNDMDFQTVFAGFANSTSSSESKIIDFKAWKASFLSIRQHVMRFYRQKYGDWPPRAKSKKNDFEESGLNRLALQDLYNDFASVYDTLVNRSSLTTRAADVASDHEIENSSDIQTSCIRRILGEYDVSAIPISPPIPYDVPNLPSLAPVRRDWSLLDAKKQKKENAKKLQDNEINLLLMQSYNRDAVTANPFLVAFMSFERRSAHNKSLNEIRDLRIGQWLLVYAVLQSLPLLVVDAPGIQYSKGVEYFLCQIPLGSAPWMHESHSRKQSWYNVAGGTGLVSLPSDVVEHGAEGVYQRSHCWQVAHKWSGKADAEEDAMISSSTSADAFSVTDSRQILGPAVPAPFGERSGSMTPTRRHRDSTGIGLEVLPLPQGVVPQQARPRSTYNPDMSFDKLLGTQQQTDGGKSAKKK